MTHPLHALEAGLGGCSQPDVSTSPNSSSPLGRPLRVVHVGPCFTRGGAEQQLIDLVRFLNPARVRIEYCIATTPEMVDPEVVADMPVPVEVGGPEAIRRAATECDVMLFWGLEVDGLLGDCRPELCVFLAHGESDWTRDLLAGSAAAVDHVVAVSRRVRDQVCAGFPCTVILNGVDTARLGRTCTRREMRARLGFRHRDFVLGYVGRFSPEKRTDTILRAVAELPASFKALLVGWGADRNRLIELANELIPGRFAFARANSHLGDYYQTLDALCLLSEYEGFALVVVEAMMCGRPVIATPVGSIPETIIDRVNGMIVDGDVASVCEAARLLRRHPHWAAAIAREGKRFADLHGHARSMARQYESLIERLWAEKHPASRTDC